MQTSPELCHESDLLREVDTLRAQRDELLAACEGIHKELWAHFKLDVKKHYSLMVADAAVSAAIAKVRT